MSDLDRVRGIKFILKTAVKSEGVWAAVILFICIDPYETRTQHMSTDQWYIKWESLRVDFQGLLKIKRHYCTALSSRILGTNSQNLRYFYIFIYAETLWHTEYLNLAYYRTLLINYYICIKTLQTDTVRTVGEWDSKCERRSKGNAREVDNTSAECSVGPLLRLPGGRQGQQHCRWWLLYWFWLVNLMNGQWVES